MIDPNWKTRFKLNLIRSIPASFIFSFIFGTVGNDVKTVKFALGFVVLFGVFWFLFTISKVDKLSKKKECLSLGEVKYRVALIDIMWLTLAIVASLINLYLSENYLLLTVVAVVYAVATSKLKADINYPYEWASSERIRQAKEKCKV